MGISCFGAVAPRCLRCSSTAPRVVAAAKNVLGIPFLYKNCDKLLHNSRIFRALRALVLSHSTFLGFSFNFGCVHYGQQLGNKCRTVPSRMTRIDERLFLF